MGVYLGPKSIYARKEGIYAKQFGKKGVDDIRDALGIMYLIYRDYKRGWTYDQSGRKIRMTWELVEKRLNFLLYLAKINKMPKRQYLKLKRIVVEWLERRKPPKIVITQGKKYIAKVKGSTKKKASTTKKKSRSKAKKRKSRKRKRR